MMIMILWSVLGGDGTVNEIINGFIENHLQTPLAILPGGTVNDFANHLHLPHDTDDFIQMIEDFQTMKVDIGKVNEHYFANVIAGGMFSDISFQVSKADKERFGPLAYYISGIRQLPTQLHTSLHLNSRALRSLLMIKLLKKMPNCLLLQTLHR